MLSVKNFVKQPLLKYSEAFLKGRLLEKRLFTIPPLY